MTNKPEEPTRLMAEINELATDMHANGTMDRAAFEKITMRQFERAETAVFAPLPGDDSRAVRDP